MRKILILLLSIVSVIANADTGRYLLSGVYYDDSNPSNSTGFYDSNKQFDDEYNVSDDYDLCWAYAASNALQYWQNQQNQTLISSLNIPNGQTQEYYQSDITYVFTKSWENSANNSIYAFQWWINGGTYDPYGVLDSSSSLYHPYPEGGSYWSSLVDSNTTVCLENPISKFFFEACGYTEDYYSQFLTQDYLLSVLATAIDNNYAMTLSISSWGGHCITLWGYEIIEDEATNDLHYYIFISDSDDAKDSKDKISDTQLIRTEIEYNQEDQLWYLTDNVSDNATGNYDGWSITAVSYLTLGVVVPEPSTYAMIFGCIALGFAIYRRRK